MSLNFFLQKIGVNSEEVQDVSPDSKLNYDNLNKDRNISGNGNGNGTGINSPSYENKLKLAPIQKKTSRSRSPDVEIDDRELTLPTIGLRSGDLESSFNSVSELRPLSSSSSNNNRRLNNTLTPLSPLTPTNAIPVNTNTNTNATTNATDNMLGINNSGYHGNSHNNPGNSGNISGVNNSNNFPIKSTSTNTSIENTPQLLKPNKNPLESEIDTGSITGSMTGSHSGSISVGSDGHSHTESLLNLWSSASMLPSTSTQDTNQGQGHTQANNNISNNSINANMKMSGLNIHNANNTNTNNTNSVNANANLSPRQLVPLAPVGLVHRESNIPNSIPIPKTNGTVNGYSHGNSYGVGNTNTNTNGGINVGTEPLALSRIHQLQGKSTENSHNSHNSTHNSHNSPHASYNNPHNSYNNPPNTYNVGGSVEPLPNISDNYDNFFCNLNDNLMGGSSALPTSKAKSYIDGEGQTGQMGHSGRTGQDEVLRSQSYIDNVGMSAAGSVGPVGPVASQSQSQSQPQAHSQLALKLKQQQSLSVQSHQQLQQQLHPNTNTNGNINGTDVGDRVAVVLQKYKGNNMEQPYMRIQQQYTTNPNTNNSNNSNTNGQSYNVSIGSNTNSNNNSHNNSYNSPNSSYNGPNAIPNNPNPNNNPNNRPNYGTTMANPNTNITTANSNANINSQYTHMVPIHNHNQASIHTGTHNYNPRDFGNTNPNINSNPNSNPSSYNRDTLPNLNNHYNNSNNSNNSNNGNNGNGAVAGTHQMLHHQQTHGQSVLPQSQMQAQVQRGYHTTTNTNGNNSGNGMNHQHMNHSILHAPHAPQGPHVSHISQSQSQSQSQGQYAQMQHHNGHNTGHNGHNGHVGQNYQQQGQLQGQLQGQRNGYQHGQQSQGQVQVQQVQGKHYPHSQQGNTPLIYSGNIGTVVYQVHFKMTHVYCCYPSESGGAPAFGLNDFVIVEADRGLALGIIVAMIPAEQFKSLHVMWGIKELKEIKWAATAADRMQLVKKAQDEHAALQLCYEKAIHIYKLPIALIDAEFQFDRQKLTLVFKSKV